MKKASAIIVVLAIAFVLLTSCRSVEKEPEEKARVVYEAVFVDDEEIDSFFREVRGDALYANAKTEFHITTAFMPEEDSRELYGTEVAVLITGYIDGEVIMEDGRPTRNEGFMVELVSKDPDMADYLNASPIFFHITGSYMDLPRYTGELDFSLGQPVFFATTGIFGAFLSDDSFIFSAEDIN